MIRAGLDVGYEILLDGEVIGSFSLCRVRHPAGHACPRVIVKHGIHPTDDEIAEAGRTASGPGHHLIARLDALGINPTQLFRCFPSREDFAALTSTESAEYDAMLGYLRRKAGLS